MTMFVIMAKSKGRRGLITTKDFVRTLSKMGISCKQVEGGYKFVNPKTKQTSNIHAHGEKHELNPSVIKKTVIWLGLDYDQFNSAVFDQ
jgi:hypothetical protein